MPYPNKPLAEMTPDEIAQLAPEDFKQLANSHNDELELRENAYERVIADSDDPANYPEMTLDAASGEWRPMTDKELNQEIYRLEVIANHPDHEISEADGRRLDALQNEERRRSEEPPLPPLEPVNEAEVDALLDQLVEQRAAKHSGLLNKLSGTEREHEPEPFGKPLIPAVIEAIKELPGTVREKMNPFQAVAKPKYVHEEDLEHDRSRERW